MLIWFRQHIKATKFLSCFLALLIPIAILWIAIVPSFAANAALTPGTWQGSGATSDHPSDFTPPSSKFSMTLTIKTVNQKYKAWTGTLQEDAFPQTVRVAGYFGSSSIKFIDAELNNGYGYSGTLSSTTINGTWYAMDNTNSRIYDGTFNLQKM